jgi:hypothetical protein
MAAPSALDFAGRARAVDRATGPLVVAVSVIAISGALRPLRWLGMVFGLWLIVAPLLLRYPAARIAPDMAVGLALILFAPLRGRTDATYGDGWRALWHNVRGRTQEAAR